MRPALLFFLRLGVGLQEQFHDRTVAAGGTHGKGRFAAFSPSLHIGVGGDQPANTLDVAGFCCENGVRGLAGHMDAGNAVQPVQVAPL